MNEVTSFCADNAGECPDNAPKPTTEIGDWSELFNPEAPNSKSLQNQSISLDGRHFCPNPDWAERDICVEYNYHSLYGILQSKVTYQILGYGATHYKA